MIGSTVNSLRLRFVTEACTGRDQCEGKAEDGRAAGRHHRQPESSPGNPATPAADDAVETPDRWIDDVASEAVRIEGAVEILEGADQHAPDRIEDEDGDEKDKERDGRDDERVALHHAAFGEPEGEKEDEDERREHSSRSHGGLALRKRAEKRFADRPVPAGKADSETLKGKDDDTAGACPGKKASSPRWIGDEAGSRGNHHGQSRKHQRPFTEGRYLHETRRCGPIFRKDPKPTETEETAVDPVPGKEHESGKPESQRDIQSAVVSFHG